MKRVFDLLILLTFVSVSDHIIAQDSGYALRFDGVDDYVSIAEDSDFDFDTTFTVEAWVKPLSLSGSGAFKGFVRGYITEPPFAGLGAWVMFLHRSNFSDWGLSVCTPFCNAATSGAGGLQVNRWQHIAATYDGNSIRSYYNGELVNSAHLTGDVGGINILLIGIWETSFNGLIDEVRLWNVTRTQSEIQENMNRCLTGSGPGLVGYWRFEEGGGLTTIDASGHGNTGILNNGVAWKRTNCIEIEQQYAVDDRWNLVSVPLGEDFYADTVLFPSAISNTFAYEGTYVIKSQLSNGVGYWLKFSGDQTISMFGSPRTVDTIEVQEGWNLIGSISIPISAASITTDPPAITTSEFFGYNHQYFIADTIFPGNGYWVKANQSGRLILSSNSMATMSNRIRIIPDSDMPPSPPEYGEMENVGAPIAFALEQNYPNPFNPLTTFNFSVPPPAGRDLVSLEGDGQLAIVGRVTLKVFDVLGREVAMIVNEELPPGVYKKTWDATGVPSGVYFYRLVAEAIPSGQAGSFIETKKLILMR